MIAATGTTIGVELSQNQANQSPQGKLGYVRSEVAVVPTNRNAGEEAGATGSGAADLGDVLMELRYNGIFSASGGIYQRLAVGKTAVGQPGATALFIKDDTGNVDPKIVEALKSIPEAPRAPSSSSSTTTTIDEAPR